MRQKNLLHLAWRVGTHAAHKPSVEDEAAHLEPASAVVWAAIFLDELPNAPAWIGVGLVVAGGAIAAQAASEEEVIGAPAAL